VSGEKLNANDPVRDQHDAALEILQRANILQRRTSDGRQQCLMHPLISEYLSARWKKLSPAKRREYEERHLRFYCDAVASGAGYPIVLEWSNVVRALENSRQRQDWASVADLTRLVAGSPETILMRKQLWRHAKSVLPLGLKASREVGDTGLEARLLYNLGISQYRTAEYSNARVAFEQAQSVAEKHGDVDLAADAGLQIGRVAYRLVDYALARGQFESLRTRSGRRRDGWRLAGALHELGRLSYREGDLEGARELLDEALRTRESMGDREGTAQTLHEVGRVLHRIGLESHREDLLVEAGMQYQKSLSLRREVGDVVGQQATIHQLGLLAFDRGEYGQARSYYDECTTLSDGLNDRFWIAHNSFRFARLLWRLGEEEAAMGRARDAQRLAGVLGIGLTSDIQRWLESRPSS